MSPSSAGMAAVGLSWDKRHKEGVLDNISAHDGHSAGRSHNTGASMLLWMLVDGIGLAIIAACTILEGFELWKDYFNEYLEMNVSSLTFWFSGRFCQIVGLMSLIIHAASMQVFHELEWAGMMMLTAGPLLNMCACSIFDSGTDPSYMFNKQWMTSESLELLGIFILDLSLIEGPEHLVLSAEITGFAILACAAILDFEYTMNRSFPSATIRVDLIHLSDCFGLGLLTIVAIGQYHIKMAKTKTSHDGISTSQHQKGHIHKNSGAFPKRKGVLGQGPGDIGYSDSGERDRMDEIESGESYDTEKSSLLPENSNWINNHQSIQGSSMHRNTNSLLQHPVPVHVHDGPSTQGDKRHGHSGSVVPLAGVHEQHND